LSGSLVRSLQPSLQQVVVVEQAGPALHAHWPPTQLLPFMHGGLHCVATHFPSMQASPFGHCVAQSPQCLGSLDGSKQPAPPGEPGAQQTWLPVQLLPPLQLHWPCAQLSPILQVRLHAPQLVTLCDTQAPPQQSWLSAHCTLPHRHWPPEQTSPVRQRLPHMPQLLGSFDVLAQPLAQQLSPALHTAPWHAQAPPEQASGVVHAWPHMPQLALSLRESTQVEPQHTVGKLQVVPPHVHEPDGEQLPSAQQTAVAPVQSMPVAPQTHWPATQLLPGLHA